MKVCMFTHPLLALGKSTFLKLLDGDLVPTEGYVGRHPKLRLARFTQYHIEMMDVEIDSVTHMRRLDGEMSVEVARKYLGRFGLQVQRIVDIRGRDLFFPLIFCLNSTSISLFLFKIYSISIALSVFYFTYFSSSVSYMNMYLLE